MKHDTTALLITGIAFVGAGICVNLGTSLAQWAESDTWPSRINWLTIIVGALGAGFTQLLAFMSSRFADWTAHRNVNGVSLPDPGQPKPPTP